MQLVVVFCPVNQNIFANIVTILAACSLLSISNGLYSTMVFVLVSPLSFIHLIASNNSGSLFMLNESASDQKLSKIPVVVVPVVELISLTLPSIISLRVSLLTMFLSL